jgi:hypothetical protein
VSFFTFTLNGALGSDWFSVLISGVHSLIVVDDPCWYRAVLQLVLGIALGLVGN